ncbi:MAG: peptidoglycan-binding domain-containing protein [Bacteroidota bacterium]
MKRLFYLICIICLPLILWFQWEKYQRFHPPVAYQYEASAAIDAHYHDQEKVAQYQKLILQIEHQARHCWFEEKIDVRHASAEAPGSAPCVERYLSLQQRTQQIEQLLVQSAQWKKQGLTNADIKRLEAENISPAELRFIQLTETKTYARLEDRGALVYQIQKRLEDKGYELLVDGLFRQETEDRIKTFQEKEGLFPSGYVDQETLTALMK